MANPTYSDERLARVITIALDADDAVTHSFQVTTVQVFKDGIAFGPPHSGDHENITPGDLEKVLPQAPLLRQISDMKAQLVAANAEIKSLKTTVADSSAANTALAERVNVLCTHFGAIGSMASEGVKASTIQPAAAPEGEAPAA